MPNIPPTFVYLHSYRVYPKTQAVKGLPAAELIKRQRDAASLIEINRKQNTTRRQQEQHQQQHRKGNSRK